MDSMKDLMRKRSAKPKPNKHLHSPAHVLADEITAAFGERKLFARYLGVILRTGEPKARAIFRTIQQDGAKEPGKLFMFLCSKSQTEKGAAPDAADAGAPKP
ncbi:MAG TPA: hypothetical protein VL426_05555 [Candidatus Binatia bacterium]|jgi:hypothetical protein|nr:hypothetical protein [Candidatus Binatia bacterium]